VSAVCVACGDPRSRALCAFGAMTVLACRSCGSTRVEPLPNADALSHFYEHEYAIVAEASRTDVRRRAETYPDTAPVVRLLRTHHAVARRVAEVGCAYGYLLWGLAQAGFEVEGYELSGATAQVGREALGLPIRSESLPPPGAGYDAIVMRHVLEHFRDPAASLERLAQALAPGGILVLATPNVGSLPARLLGRDWEWMAPPAHLHLYTARGLKLAQERAGFEVLRTWTRRGDARPFSFGLVRALAARTGIKAALGAQVGTFGPESVPPAGGGGRAATAKRTLLAGFGAIDVVLHPLWWLSWQAGMGEEMWTVARRLER
jgi:SAM-dependent methyltransferase